MHNKYIYVNQMNPAKRVIIAQQELALPPPTPKNI